MIKYPQIIPTAFASKGDKNTIPATNDISFGEASFEYGFPPVTQLPIKSGGIAPRRNDFNGIFNAITEHLLYLQSGGAMTWSEHLNYPVNAIVYASNGIQYRCIIENGVSASAGVKNPIAEPEYWENAASPLLYTGAFVSLYEESPPPHFYMRDGAVIHDASFEVPRLYKSLQLSKNQWKLKTEAQWQEMQTQYGGIGGVPFFVLDTYANTIRLPDTRSMYARGGNEAVGTVLKSGLPEVSGFFNVLFKNANGEATGAFSDGFNIYYGSLTTTGAQVYVQSMAFNASASNAIYGGAQNVQPNTYVHLDCIYAG